MEGLDFAEDNALLPNIKTQVNINEQEIVDTFTYLGRVASSAGKLKVGIPKTTWRGTTEQERTKLDWISWVSARSIAKDRQRWR